MGKKLTGCKKIREKINAGSMFRSDKAGQLCLSQPEVPSNFAKDNRLTNSAQEVMISDVLLNLLTFS